MAAKQVKQTTDRVRQIEALNLRRAGASYQQIADRLGYSDYQSAFRSVQNLLKKMTSESVEELRAVENERLDTMQIAVWNDAVKGDDRAINTVIRISERRARLNGLDAPVQLTGADGGAILIKLDQ